MAGSLFAEAVMNAVGVGVTVGTSVGVAVGVCVGATWVDIGKGVAVGTVGALHADMRTEKIETTRIFFIISQYSNHWQK